MDELYASFGDEPLAAGSLGRSIGPSSPTAQRSPSRCSATGSQQRVHVDLELISYLAGILEDHSDELRLYRPRELAARFRSRTLEELDFEREAQNAARFAANFADEPDVVFPRVYPELSSGRVLTMSLIEGTTFASLTPSSAQRHRRQGARPAGRRDLARDGLPRRFCPFRPAPGQPRRDVGLPAGDHRHRHGASASTTGRASSSSSCSTRLWAAARTDLAEALLDTCEHPPGIDTAGLAEDLDGLITTYWNRSLRSIDADRGDPGFRRGRSQAPAACFRPRSACCCRS